MKPCFLSMIQVINTRSTRTRKKYCYWIKMAIKNIKLLMKTIFHSWFLLGMSSLQLNTTRVLAAIS